METFTCINCNYSSTVKCNYKRHLTTMKHIRNIKTNGNKYINIQKDPKKTQKDPKRPNKNNEKDKYNCIYCCSVFSTFAHKRRHELHRCQHTQALNERNERKVRENKKEITELKKEHQKTIEILLSKVGTTNNIITTNNININSYGKEDMSHITDTFKTQMLNSPYKMIPKMIEEVHFNENKPENKNIFLPNKKDNKIKIFTNNKWIYKNKDQIIHDLIDGKYFIMDTHYETICNKIRNTNYEKFRTKYDDKDKEVLDLIKQESELVLLNNR